MNSGASPLKLYTITAGDSSCCGCTSGASSPQLCLQESTHISCSICNGSKFWRVLKLLVMDVYSHSGITKLYMTKFQALLTNYYRLWL